MINSEKMENYVSTKQFRKGVRFHIRKMLILAENELKAVRNNKQLIVSELLNPILYLIFFMAGLRGMTGAVKVANYKNIF